ncbi:adenosylcobinamide-GDP ribazoletransferase [Shimia sp. FJ5]|uniref:adenosylcobinamide-GDP ribazoletransferase n=1 Tax=Shimia sp. FJ5 TaxID=3079054 RepID=UPI00260ACAAC|nr:adenosylcobinamide-GDP ribazoletransferase [Shimia sp. FJ5]MDV4145339.1 adenosylcobinamide-GDP ribazoletransferase [Shimia sp. FJ5]
MTQDDTRLAMPSDITTALALLTRLPVHAAFERGARAAWAYPLAGLAVALVAALPTGVLLCFGVAPLLAGVVFVALQVILTGAMHEDGLADSADGLWGGWERVRRLEIMKDSHIGSYGVLALVLALGARILAVGLLLGHGGWLWPLLAVAMLSRATMPALMAALPHARDTGLSHAQGRAPQETALLAAGLAALAALLFCGFSGIGLALLAGLTALTCAAIAKAKIAGQTGDILGATQQMTEIALLIALTA